MKMESRSVPVIPQLDNDMDNDILFQQDAAKLISS
jgi:hypothetical protein